MTTSRCSGGSVSYEISSPEGKTFSSGSMTEGPAETYKVTVLALYPNHGYANIEIAISCPDDSSNTIDFKIYIDPSGAVKTTSGDPIEGATVTLYRSDTKAGTFEPVPDGSDTMSPVNRNNPDKTDSDGHFGWDVTAGYYKVRAEKDGCVSPTDPKQSYAETDVLEVPPEVTDLDLTLDCGSTDKTAPKLELPSDITQEAEDKDGAKVTYTATATDEDPANPEVSCAPASGETFPIARPRSTARLPTRLAAKLQTASR